MDIEAKQKAIKIWWVFKVQEDTFLAECMYQSLCPILRQLIFRSNISVRDCHSCFGADDFWRQLLIAWAEMNYKMPSSWDEVLNQFLWYNTKIRINNRPFCWKKWVKQDIYYVSDILDNDGKVRPVLNVCWLELQQITHAIPDLGKS